MTVVVDETVEIPIYFNIPNLPSTVYTWTITSQYSHEPVVINGGLQSSNDRWSTINFVLWPEFYDTHKNGIYNWSLATIDGPVIEEGLVKIICDPGGGTGIIDYTSTPATEDREAEVYYRPNY